MEPSEEVASPHHTGQGECGGPAERPPPISAAIEHTLKSKLGGKAAWSKAASGAYNQRAGQAQPKLSWAANAAAAAEQLKREQKEKEFSETKDAVEQMMEWKVRQQRAVQAVFLWDCGQLIFYICFLMLFSVNSWKNPDTYQLYTIKSIVDGKCSYLSLSLPLSHASTQIHTHTHTHTV